MVVWCRALLLLNAALLWSWLLLCAALYAVLLEAGWNALFFEADRSNGLLELLCSSLARFCWVAAICSLVCYASRSWLDCFAF